MNKEIFKGLLFKTKNNNVYLFDGITGMIEAVDDVMIDCINLYISNYSKKNIKKSLLQKYADEIMVDGAINHIFDLMDYGCFFENENPLKKARSRDVKENLIDHGNTFQLILNVTENCNFRCKYCYLSEIYDYTRNRTDNNMSFETAKRAMDSFFDKLRKIAEFNPGKEAAISFYGGEPLMCFELIKQCVDYAEKNSPVKILFSISTNGSLLDSKKTSFLTEKDFYIGVSLDGYKKNNDRNRVFSGELGTYDLVLRNLKEFKNKYPQYVKISLLVVLDYKTNLIAMDDFFEKSDLPRVGFVSMVLDNNTDYYKQFSDEDYSNFEKGYLTLRDKYIINKINNNEISSFSLALFEISMSGVLYRSKMKDSRIGIMPYTGSCIPGSKQSVRADGTIDICERVNESFPIGNVYDGINYRKIASIINMYNGEIEGECRKCPINKDCPTCFAQCMDASCFHKPDCKSNINSFIENLSIMYSVLEMNPNAYDNYKIPIEQILGN